MADDGGVPAAARVVIVGGGIMGTGLAHGLVAEGCRDVVLFEKAELTSGSTWHAAGQITHSTSNFALGRCVGYNIGLYSGALEKESGQPVTWHGCGSLRLAYTGDEMDWLRHTLSVGAALGFAMEIVGPGRIAELHPFYVLDGVRGALHTPDDGHVDPSGVVQAFAAVARRAGVAIVRRCRVTDIRRRPGGEWLVASERGDVVCEHVVNAAGTYARQVGAWTGLELPMTSMTHHYLVTEPVPGFRALDRELPVVRDDREVSGYVRMEQQSGLIGIYEKENPNAVWVDHCPWEAENELFAPDWERIMPWLDRAMERMPVLRDAGIRRVVHGAISHPPDGNPLIGPAPGAQNYWCCCGTQIGIGWGPGLARELARWIVHGAADLSMREFDPRRFGAWASPAWQVIKAKEDYCLRHETPFPHYNRPAGRPLRPSPLHGRNSGAGAVFEEVCGHERPRWFARGGVAARDHYSFRRTAVDGLVAAEVRGVRERAGLMDITAFARVEVRGADAMAWLDGLVANRLPRRDGGIVLAHMLNHRGRIELELTVVRMTAERFCLMAAAFFERRLLDHLAAHRRAHAVEIVNRSDDWASLSLQGPRSREVLAAATGAALDNASWPWMAARRTAVAGQAVWAMRMSYVGELGWEIHGPRERLAAVHDALMDAGERHRIVPFGSFAMNAMRMEKAFRGATELTNEVTLPEAGVMRFAKLDKGEFLGRAATAACLERPPRWSCAYLAVESDGDSDGHGGEAVVRGGRTVGTVSSIAFGHWTGRLLAFAYVGPGVSQPGTRLEVVIMGRPRAAVVLGEAVHDPANRRPRADAGHAAT